MIKKFERWESGFKLNVSKIRNVIMAFIFSSNCCRVLEITNGCNYPKSCNLNKTIQLKSIFESSQKYFLWEKYRETTEVLLNTMIKARTCLNQTTKFSFWICRILLSSLPNYIILYLQGCSYYRQVIRSAMIRRLIVKTFKFVGVIIVAHSAHFHKLGWNKREETTNFERLHTYCKHNVKVLHCKCLRTGSLKIQKHTNREFDKADITVNRTV